MLRLAGLILPLGLDTFAVAAALGLTGLGGGQRLRLGLVFTAFEGGMPLVGLLIGAGLGRLVGGFADYVAILVLFGLGVWMLLADEGKEEERAQRFVSSSGAAVLGLGLSISLDELAIGFTLGLVHVSVVAASILIAIQAFLVSQLGFIVGGRLGDGFREAAEGLAAIVLISLGGLLLLSKFLQLPL